MSENIPMAAAASVTALERLLEDPGSDPRARVDLMNQLCWKLRAGGDWRRILNLSLEARQLAESCGYAKGISLSRRDSAFAYYMSSDYPTAARECLEGLRHAEEQGDVEGEANLRGVLAYVHWSVGDYEAALEEGLNALRIFEELGDPEGLAWCYHGLGNFSHDIRDNEQALRYLRQALDIFCRLNDAVGEARSLVGIGAVYHTMGDLDQALECHTRALDLFRGLGNRVGESRALNDIAAIYQQRGEDERALELHQESLAIRQKDGSLSAETTSLMNLARIYDKRGEADRAREALERALSISEQIGARPKAYQAHQLLAELHERNGNLAAALRHVKEFVRLREMVFNEEQNTKLRNLQVSMCVERSRKESEIHVLRNIELRTKNEQLAQLLEELQGAQAQLLQSEKMAALGGLVAALAHEINSPVGVILSNTDLSRRCVARIREGVDTSPVANAVETLCRNEDSSMEAARRIASIVRSLKSFAQIDGAEYQRVNLEESLDTAITLVEPEFRGRVTLERRYSGLAPLYGYAAELNQVFMNLLLNAGQAIDGAGTVTVETFANDEHAGVRVNDTGRGIPADQIPRLFTPSFTRSGARVKASFSLFAAYHTVQKHGGEIRVESAPGHGASFTVLLPRRLETTPDRS